MPQFDITIAGDLNLDIILYGLPEKLPFEQELRKIFRSNALRWIPGLR